MTTTQNTKNSTKNRILAACVKLFIEHGYYKTTLSKIVKEAGVSFSSFQNLFRTKDGVLLELTEYMFDRQFEAAKFVGGKDINPIYIYVVETAIQMTITELNDNIREIYVEAYSHPESSEYIYRRTAAELSRIFDKYNPDKTEGDFYETELATAGIMRNYMARKCDQYFTLDKKLSSFLSISLRVYNVPQKEIDESIAYILGMDIEELSNKIMYKLFESLAMQLNFKLGAI